ncbi:MAG: metal-sulfur cluster assembly factor [Anaerolineae bacterium]|nr:metal-sulfur cluster assembly factor [Anaerolineae bacterium]
MTEDDVFETLRMVIDPELGVNIVDLGLVYDARITDSSLNIALTMTTPACPLSEYLLSQTEAVIRQRFPNLQSLRIELVFEPLWNPMMMSWSARETLGWM